MPAPTIPRYPCKGCRGRGIVIESRVCLNGTRKRRIECTSCGLRWTIWLGDRPIPGGQGPRQRGKGLPPAPRLTEDQVREILLDETRTLGQLARAFGRTGEAVRKVRVGLSYAHVLPELPRKGAPRVAAFTCHDCDHWGDGCLMRLPDPSLEGIGFAEDCVLFKDRRSLSQASAATSPVPAAC